MTAMSRVGGLAGSRDEASIGFAWAKRIGDIRVVGERLDLACAKGTASSNRPEPTLLRKGDKGVKLARPPTVLYKRAVQLHELTFFDLSEPRGRRQEI
jgi:hypothetical protein